MIEYGFSFSDQQAISSDFSGGVVSSVVYDAGAAVKMFEGVPGSFVIAGEFTAQTHDPVVIVKFLGADDAALTTNPIVIAQHTSEGLTTAKLLTSHFELHPGNQQTAKQFYGLWYVGDDSSARCTVNASGCGTGQSNMRP